MASETADAHCTLTQAGAVTTVAVGVKCSVSYEFDTSASNADLALPYALAINGSALPAYADKPRSLSGSNRKISLLVEPGSKVALFLNSDAHPDYRRQPVYTVQVGANDVRVKITERKGRIGHERSTLRSPTCRAPTAPGGKRIDSYDGALTGDIWMEISHRYTVAEADALLSADTAPAIRAAVRSIYAVLPKRELLVAFAASDAAPKLTIRVRFGESDNVLANTTYCPLLEDVLPRTHPRAYAALLTEARAAGVTEVHVTSCWRPMLGSIAHRAGLGLDIVYIENADQHVSINRAALTSTKLQSNNNVSEREQTLYAGYQHAKKEREKSEKELEATKKQLAHHHDENEASQQIASINDRTKHRIKLEKDAEREWNEERNKHEPDLIHSLRRKLELNQSIAQIFDPWYMDANAKDNAPPIPNEQRSRNEKLHNNHLHITVLEPKIL